MLKLIKVFYFFSFFPLENEEEIFHYIETLVRLLLSFQSNDMF